MRRSFTLAYRSAGITVEDFEGPQFKRIEHVNQLLATGRLDSSFAMDRTREKKEMV